MIAPVPRGRYFECVAGDVFDDESTSIRCPLCGLLYDCALEDEVAKHFGALPHPKRASSIIAA